MRTIPLKRRSFLGGLLALAAPAIIRTPGLLMPIKVQRLDWVPCDGRALSCAQYPNLFAAIGLTYGSGGPNTFRVPQLAERGRSHPMRFEIAANADDCVAAGTILPVIHRYASVACEGVGLSRM